MLPRHRLNTLIPLLGVVVLLQSALLSYSHANRQSDAQARLEQVRAEIHQLQQERDSGDHERAQLVQDLRHLEVDIGEQSRALRQLNTELGSTREQLQTLRAQTASEEQQLQERQRQLNEQLALAYRLGRQSRLKLIFNLEDPARSSRLLAYHGYFSRAQSQRIRAVLEQLQQLQQLARQTAQREQELSALTQQQQQRLDQLQFSYQQRGDVITDLDHKLATLSARIDELRANQRDLERLLQRLQNALTDIPETLGEQPFRELLGKLKAPVSGQLSVRFGQPEQDGRPGTGVVFSANAGADVNSVGYGRVAFADWLRGYGLLMIIDHGDGYMSLYGRNESLLFEAGDWVESGATIAVVGRGNLDAPQGLYFELRKDGRAVDPERWFKRPAR